MSGIMADQDEAIRCRYATAADYNAVMAIIPDLYGGNDVLPYRYMKDVRDPLRLLLLAEKGNRVVSKYMPIGYTLQRIISD